jgi:putative transposase
MQRNLSCYEQEKQLTLLRQEFPEFKEVNCEVLHETIQRLDRAYQRFFNGLKSGKKVGYPRFKRKEVFTSLRFWPTCFKLSGKYLQLSKIGNIKLKLSRPLPPDSRIIHCTMKESNGRWFACFAVEYTPTPILGRNKRIGIDVGIENFAALSDGTFIENPRYFERSQKKLRRAQRRIAIPRKEKDSNRRKKAKILASKVYQKIANQRNDFLHKLSTNLVRKYDHIAVEDLNIAGLAGGFLAKQVRDCSWGILITFLSYKEAESGGILEKVSSNRTSQECPRCGRIKKKDLSERMHNCDCGYSTHRDHAAAQIVLGRAVLLGANAAVVNAA